MALIAANEIKTVAILGAGVIGSGWASRFLANGLDVVAWDPGNGAEAQLRANVANAWPALTKVGLKPGASQGRLKFVATMEEAVKDADFVQESAPENEGLKVKMHAQATAAAKPGAIFGSSTSGLLPSDFYKETKNPERCLVGHPFNPVYLLPLVEVCGSKWTTDEAKQIAIAFYKSLGMRPLHVRKEVPGFIADRLLEAVWREGMHMINDDYCTTGELDDAIRFGFGIRWSFFGMYMIYHMAGGEAGMRHFMEQFGPALDLPWTHLKAPKLTTEIIDKIVDGTEQQAGKHSIKELERLRDDCIISVIGAVTDAKARHGWKFED
jgi:carnitine 3-dehydrogenase